MIIEVYNHPIVFHISVAFMTIEILKVVFNEQNRWACFLKNNLIVPTHGKLKNGKSYSTIPTTNNLSGVVDQVERLPLKKLCVPFVKWSRDVVNRSVTFPLP